MLCNSINIFLQIRLYFAMASIRQAKQCIVVKTQLKAKRSSLLMWVVRLNSQTIQRRIQKLFLGELLRINKCFLAVLCHQIKFSLYSRYYAKACNEWRGPSPHLSAWATQLRRNVAAVASRWRPCVDLTGPGIEPQTSHTDNLCA